LPSSCSAFCITPSFRHQGPLVRRRPLQLLSASPDEGLQQFKSLFSNPEPDKTLALPVPEIQDEPPSAVVNLESLFSEPEKRATEVPPVEVEAAKVEINHSPVEFAPMDVTAPIIPDTSADVTFSVSPDIAAGTVHVHQLTEQIILAITQENIGLGVVFIIEALYSFLKYPSLEHAVVLIGAALGSPVLFFFVSPMLNSGNPGQVSMGLEAAMGVSIFVALTYLIRMLNPSPYVAKEVPAFAILVCIAGFTSFSQNLLAIGASFPSLPLPELGSITISLPHFVIPGL